MALSNKTHSARNISCLRVWRISCLHVSKKPLFSRLLVCAFYNPALMGWEKRIANIWIFSIEKGKDTNWICRKSGYGSNKKQIRLYKSKNKELKLYSNNLRLSSWSFGHLPRIWRTHASVPIPVDTLVISCEPMIGQGFCVGSDFRLEVPLGSNEGNVERYRGHHSNCRIHLVDGY